MFQKNAVKHAPQSVHQESLEGFALVDDDVQLENAGVKTADNTLFLLCVNIHDDEATGVRADERVVAPFERPPPLARRHASATGDNKVQGQH